MTAITKAPPIQKLDHWTLVSSDIDRTVRFYTEVMGGEGPRRTSSGTGPVSVDLAGTIIDFFAANQDQQPTPGSHGQHHAYIIKLEDYDPWVEHFKAMGVEHRRTTHGVGRLSVYVDDPDGFHIELTVPFEDQETGRREIEKRGLLGTRN